jgi:hypothetical protein
MKMVYSRFPIDRLRQIVSNGTIKEYVTAAKQVLEEREESESASK